MMNLDLIFDKAVYTHRLNKELQSEKDKIYEEANREREENILNMRINEASTTNYETDCYSKEMLELIKRYNFKIESYEKFTEFDDYDYCATLETYYCSYNNWNFEIKNNSDCDIEEGIFSLSNIKHKITEEKVNFYCDIGCRNTNEIRLDTFLEFITYDCLEDYIKYKYHRYIILPTLLEGQGYTVEKTNYNFELNSCTGYLKLDNNLYVKVYSAWFNDFKLVVTNDNTWDVNSSNHSLYSFGKKAYYFEYNDLNTITELCKCIEAFKEDRAGKMGYCENDRYYSNRDVTSLFDGLRDKENRYKDCWNHYQIKVEHKNDWDSRGYRESESKVLNKYTGLELYVQTEFTFNDASQWSVGDYINKSIIVFEYDKRKDDTACRLKIDNYVYKSGELEIYEPSEDENEEGDSRLDETKLVASIESYGSFTELYDSLKNYVYKMCELHEIIL